MKNRWIWNFNDYENNIAIITDDGFGITYGEMFLRQNKIAKKIGERCLVFIVCSNTIGCLVGYLSCLTNKIVPLMIDENMGSCAILGLVDEYKPKYLWLPKDCNIFKMNTVVFQQDEYKLICLNHDKYYSLNEDLALLLTTSGTTASKKMVRIGYDNIISNTNAIVEYLNINDKEKTILVLPMSYTYGLSVVNTHMAVGATILITSKKVLHKQFWDFFNQHKATSIAGVPIMFEMLKKINFSNFFVPTLKVLTQAGGKLPVSVHKYFAEYAKKTNSMFIVMYGQTEATARISYLPNDKSLDKVGSIGIPIPNGKLRLISGDGKEITEAGQEGELVYEGDNVTLGYALSGEDLVKGDERKRTLFTGDIGYKDADGYYYISGRKNRYDKIYGNRINLDEIEIILKEHFGENMPCLQGENYINIFISNVSNEYEIKSFLSNETGFPRTVFEVRYIKKMPFFKSG